MKKLTPLLCVAIAAFLSVSCTNNDRPVPDSVGAAIRLDSTDSSVFRPWALAKEDIVYYDKLCNKLFHGDTPIHYYTVRVQDLLAAMGADSSLLRSPGAFRYPYVRVTLAFQQDVNQFKLYIQPVAGANLDSPEKKAGRALFFRRNGAIDSTLDPRSSDSGYVADLNAPCPNTCSN